VSEPGYERIISLEATPAEVWAALTEHEQLGAWFGGDLTLEPRPGGRVSLLGDDGERRHGTVEAIDPGRRLVFRWWEPGLATTASGTRVDLELVEVPDGGTRLTVREDTLRRARGTLARV
jgi:uncharacterized protein YndB with AHSA1/START domain